MTVVYIYFILHSSFCYQFSKVKIDFQVTTFTKFVFVQWVLCGGFLSCLFTGLWFVKS